MSDLMKRIQRELGRVRVSDDPLSDNLAIALLSYFDRHHGKPDADEKTERGWHPWVEEQADKALMRIAEAAVRAAR